MANFEAFHQVISSSKSLIFLKSVMMPVEHFSDQTLRSISSLYFHQVIFRFGANFGTAPHDLIQFDWVKVYKFFYLNYVASSAMLYI